MNGNQSAKSVQNPSAMSHAAPRITPNFGNLNRRRGAAGTGAIAADGCGSGALPAEGMVVESVVSVMSGASDRSGQRAPANGTTMGFGGAAPVFERSRCYPNALT